jgi:hypothetical protein
LIAHLKHRAVRTEKSIELLENHFHVAKAAKAYYEGDEEEDGGGSGRELRMASKETEYAA